MSATIYDLAEALARVRPAETADVPRDRYAEVFRLFERNPADYGVALDAPSADVRRCIERFTDRWARPAA
jgi:hypothetical protein